MAKAEKKTPGKPTPTAPVKKGPVPNYTPKGGVSLKVAKELEKVKGPIYYRAEPGFSIREDGATCSWNEASRQLCMDAAQLFLTEYSAAARPLLFEFAGKAALCPDWKTLNDMEFRYHGNLVTKGSHMKRQRFWKFISYIGAGRIPPDVVLHRTGITREGFTGIGRAEAIEYLCEEVKKKAATLLEGGSAPSTLMRVNCTVSYWERNCEWVVSFEVAPHNYDPVKMKGYKTLAEWSTHP
jgi:hypothetical protein